MVDDPRAAPAEAARASAPLFPENLLRELAALAGADVATVYLSEPASPFDRSSYLIIGTCGVAPDYQPHMRGPLKPRSIRLFSAWDRQPELLVEDVSAEPRFAESWFARIHGVRSLVRLSIRTAEIGHVTPFARMPTLLEVFLSFQRARGREELQAASALSQKFLREHLPAIRKHRPLARLLNPRKTADKYRRLDGIARTLEEQSDFKALGRGVRDQVAKSYAAVSQFVLDCCNLRSNDSAVEFFHCYEWSPGQREATALYRHPSRAWKSPAERGAVGFAALLDKVVATQTSVVLQNAPALAPGWKALLEQIGGPRFCAAVPLFARERMTGILLVCSRGRLGSAAALVTLWRMLPQIERVVADAVAYDAAADERESRQAKHRLISIPMAPRHDAVQERLRTLGRHLRADAARLVEADETGSSVYCWAAPNARIQSRPEPLELRPYFQSDPETRTVLVEAFGDQAVRAHAYRIATHARSRPVAREPLPAGPTADFAPVVTGLHAPGARQRTSALVFPLWQPKPGRAREHQVKGVLCIWWLGENRPELTPSRIEILDALARVFSSVTYSIDKTAQKAGLIAWASAGVGPIHQLVKVVEACREGIRNLAADPAELGALRERVEVLYEQLWVLHQFSRGVERPREGTATRYATVAEAVRSGVRRAMLLTGEIEAPILEIHPDCERARMQYGDQTAVNAVLSCAISNSTRYGIGLSVVRARLDRAAGRVILEVINRAGSEDGTEHLDDAGRIAALVCRGDSASVFERLVEQVERRGLRGIGTWIAARVTHELLDGIYELSYRPVAADPGELEVKATMSFPLGRAAAAGAGES